jgi:hypothetical protein
MDLTKDRGQLADRALGILGVSVVRPPAASGTKTAEQLADRALVKVGASVLRPPAASGTKTSAQLADRALVKLGASVLRPPAASGTKTNNNLADRALEKLQVSVLRPPAASGTLDQDALIARVLKKLQVTGDGDDPSAEEIANLQTLIPLVIASLAQRGIVSITNIEAIPQAQFEPLADIIALAHAPDHGKAGNPALATFAQKAESDLRAMALIDLADASVPVLIASLAQRGVATLTSDAIAIAEFEAAADILAAMLAPTVGKGGDPSITAQAVKSESDLRAMALVALMDAAVAPLVAALAQRGIVSISDISAIPQAYFEALADLLALENATQFGRAADATLIALAQKAEADLKSIGLIALMDAAIAPLLATLAQRGIVVITDTSAIPQAYFEPLADLVAFASAGQFGKSGDAMLSGLAQKAEADLRIIQAIARLDDAIDGILEDLNLRGIVEIADADAVPVGLFEAVARIVANAVASDFGRQESEALREQYEERLRVATRRGQAASRTLRTDSVLRAGVSRVSRSTRPY